MKPATLMYGSGDKNKDIFYSTKFHTPSQFMLIIINGVKYAIVPKSEFSDAKKKAVVDEVLSFDDFISSKDYVDLERRRNSPPSRFGYASEIINSFLKQKGVKQVFVQPDFPFKMAQVLKWYGFAVKIEESFPFFKQRLIKNDEELKSIRKSIAAAELSMGTIFDTLKKADVHHDVLYNEGIPLTSESLRHLIRVQLYDNGFVLPHPIVSSGFGTSTPHNEGAGPIKVNNPVLVDIFPKSMSSGYFADVSRTFVRGKPSQEIKNMHTAVLDAQELAISMVKEGVKVSSMYNAALDLFNSRGFKTDEGKNFGFVHSLGHGVGLDVHEPPSLSSNEDVLVSGNVIAIEPGLYYPTVGGVRIEDVVLVNKNGCEVLSSFSKQLEI